jgi:hypothetical protein
VRKILAAALLFLATPLAAQDPDTQVRTLLHVQRTGWAIWTVVPDWTLPEPKLLAVAGPLWEHHNKELKLRQWTEVMGGFLRHGDTGDINPVFNIRTFRSQPQVDLYAETLYNFSTERVGVSAFALFPAWKKLQAGLEVDASFGRGKPDIGMGPRLSLPFKCGRARCALALTYLWRADKKDIARSYSPVNFLPD